MFVVSLALAAVLVASGGGSDAGPPVAAAGESTGTPFVATPSSTPEPSATPEPTPLPAIPVQLQRRLNALPEKLRNETLLAYATGSLRLEQVELIVAFYENRNPNVRVGSVLGASDGVLRFEVFTTGELAEIATGEQTLIRRAGADIGLEDLLPEELVMVVSTDEGALALTIEAFGVSAP